VNIFTKPTPSPTEEGRDVLVSGEYNLVKYPDQPVCV